MNTIEWHANHLRLLSAADRIRWAVEEFPGKIELVCSLAVDSAVLLHLATQAAPGVPIALRDGAAQAGGTGCARFRTDLEARLNLRLGPGASHDAHPACSLHDSGTAGAEPASLLSLLPDGGILLRPLADWSAVQIRVYSRQQLLPLHPQLSQAGGAEPQAVAAEPVPEATPSAAADSFGLAQAYGFVNDGPYPST